ncbi:hypothetical protein HPP92_018840 [Vanilla planifolia]|uniref:Uncharacterized protein n=1 Tax=Vanilla planifolia TaxID=51239 RepID=A0A835UNR4_VANPL|nr:hypothetical protein HPP92_018840 [Vanilla planifolia]
MSKVTSICGIPQGRRDARELKFSKELVVCNISLSPVGREPRPGSGCQLPEKTWLFFVGMVVFRLMRRVNIPQKGLNAKESGDVKKQELLDVARRIPRGSQPPMAALASGFTPLLGSLPKKQLRSAEPWEPWSCRRPTAPRRPPLLRFRHPSNSSCKGSGSLDQMIDRASERIVLGEVECFAPEASGCLRLV